MVAVQTPGPGRGTCAPPNEEGSRGRSPKWILTIRVPESPYTDGPLERPEGGTPIRPLTFAVFFLLAVPALAPYLGAPAPMDGASVDARGPEGAADPPAGPMVGTQKAAALDAFRSLDGYFIGNEGQVEDHVRYYAMGNPAVAFRDDGILFVLGAENRGQPEARGSGVAPPVLVSSAAGLRVERISYAYLIRFEGGRGQAPVGREELPFESNFLLGNDPSRWRVGVQNFRQVVYPDLYAGIDLAFHMSRDGLKYEFHVRPFADLRAIRMTVVGAGSLEVDPLGLTISTPFGTVRDSAPFSYQEGGTPVDCRFALRTARSYGFDCSGRDPAQPLTIDPLVYSTFLGGSDDAFFGYQRNPYSGEWEPVTCGQSDRGVSIGVDGAGNAYVLGSTCSMNFPVTPGAFNTTYWKYWDPTWQQYFTGDPQQLFIAKLNPSGSALVYATYLGGYRAPSAPSGGHDQPASIAIDSAGNAYVAGTTLSYDYPTTAGAFQRSFTCWSFTSGFCFWNAFVTKLNAAGNGLVYSTFLAGRGYQFAWSLAVDTAGNAYVAGETNSTDFPTTPGAFDREYNTYDERELDLPDVFVAKLNPSGSGLVYSTYVGGVGWDWPFALTIDPAGSAYVTGDTNSEDFPTTPGAYDRGPLSPMDTFVLKLNATGSTLAYSTFLGGDRWENAFGIAVDGAGYAYVTGQTNSTDFPTTPGALRRVLMGGADAFVTKLDPSGAALAYSTFLGGSTFNDCGTSVAVDSLGHAYVTGFTYSVDFPLTPDAFDTHLDSREGFITELNPSGTGLVYSTYIGGSGADDQGSSIKVDALGIAYVTGWTNSSNFPTTPDAFDRTLDGKGDAFVVKLVPVTARDPPDLGLTPADIAFNPPAPARLGTSVAIAATVHNVGGTNASNVLVRFHDGPPSGSNQIGADQVLPFVERFDGTATASVPWTAGPLGTHDIWVVVDPLNAIPEGREDNNQADTPIDVRPLEPDLAVSASDLSLSPAPPYPRGTSVQITATIHNIGAASSGATTARFTDGGPPLKQIGTDQSLPALSAGGTASVSVIWNAPSVGTHTLCAAADPENLVSEMDEGNNEGCTSAKVLMPPDLEPVRVLIAPPSPLPFGSPAWVNVTVVNWGEEATGAFDVLLFDDANGNRVPDTGESRTLAPVAGVGGWDGTLVPLTWTASSAGVRSLCVYVDPPPGAVAEYNEVNNLACASVTVLAPPPTLPDYVPLLPQPSGPIRIGLRTPIMLSVQVRNEGNGTADRNATIGFRNGTASPFASFVVPPLAPGRDSSRFSVSWTSPGIPGVYHVVADVDDGDVVPEWNETNNVYTWTITVLGGPLTSLVLGSPNVTAAVTYVTSSTPLSLSVVDQSGAGIRRTAYRVDNGTWTDYAITGPLTLAGDGEHFVEWYSEDNANNTEVVASRLLRLDDTPPTTTASFGEPTYTAGSLYVTSAAPMTLTAVDGGVAPVGLAVVAYRIDGGTWRTYTAPFTVDGSDGLHTIAYRASDLLGNAANRTISVILDDTPPTTTLAPAAGPNTTATMFTLSVMDEGSGVNGTEYRMNGGPWTTYAGAFTLAAGDHVISYRSVDRLGNREPERTKAIHVEGPPSPSAANLKPFIAAVFAIVLALVGAWSARRAPWPAGSRRRLRAFVLLVLPFVVAEGATGAVSLFTGLLAVPPLLGAGTAMDLAILVAGVVVSLFRIRTRTSGS